VYLIGNMVFFHWKDQLVDTVGGEIMAVCCQNRGKNTKVVLLNLVLCKGTTKFQLKGYAVCVWYCPGLNSLLFSVYVL
jgi:hypothetical protein